MINKEPLSAEHPKKCPITGRKFFMSIELDGQFVPTYGGPLDSYTIPERCEDDDELTYTVERFYHDEGAWMGPESLYAEDIIEMLKYQITDEDVGHWIKMSATLTQQLQDAKKDLDECRNALEEIEAFDRASNTDTDSECLDKVFGIAKETLTKLKIK